MRDIVIDADIDLLRILGIQGKGDEEIRQTVSVCVCRLQAGKTPNIRPRLLDLLGDRTIVPSGGKGKCTVTISCDPDKQGTCGGKTGTIHSATGRQRGNYQHIGLSVAIEITQGQDVTPVRKRCRYVLGP